MNLHAIDGNANDMLRWYEIHWPTWDWAVINGEFSYRSHTPQPGFNHWIPMPEDGHRENVEEYHDWVRMGRPQTRRRP
jgi:hypothetical protein